MTPPDPKPTLYLETSVVSYYVARPSRDTVTLAHQQITWNWWEHKLPLFTAYVSSVVMEEIGAGNPEEIQKRLRAANGFKILAVESRAERLAAIYMKKAGLPEKAFRDALHIAVASLADMRFLVTWNCRHIAGAVVREKVRAINLELGIPCPTLCTPEELMDEPDED